ncbi:MAG: hypothetical protein IJ137_05035 [Eubacterium sp.]|nr:hypothetical protein [Eubacterium sp.]
MSMMNEAAWVSLSEIIEEKTFALSDTGKRIEKRVWFPSMRVLIQGALSFVAYFEHIHKDGYVYGSNATEPFRISLKTGELPMEKLLADTKKYLVKDYSSVSMEDLADGAVSYDEFLAPELVEAAASGTDLTFCVETDWYFMSVFLFEYFFHTGSPFEGKMMVNRCFLSPMEKELYRSREGQFCLDIGEVHNPPVKGIQDKLLGYWDEYPDILHKMFQKAFMDGGNLTNLRPTEIDWKQALVRMIMDYQECSCGFKGFSFRLKEKENGTYVCPQCGKPFYPMSDGLDRILLAEGKKLYACQTSRDPFDKDTVTGLIVENKRKKGLFGIKNVSKDTWRGMYPDGTTREIGEGQGIPIWDGMKLRFERGEDWTLRLIQPIELYDESEVEEDEQ